MPNHKNVKDVLDEIPIHIYKNIIKGAYDRNEKCNAHIPMGSGNQYYQNCFPVVKFHLLTYIIS